MSGTGGSGLPPYDFSRAAGYPPDLTIGDPVSLKSGNFVWPEVDLEIKGRLPLVINRVYNSLDNRQHLFGKGWSSILDTRLELTASQATFINFDGSSTRFAKDPQNLCTGPVNSDLVLTYSPDTSFWTAAYRNQAEWTFDESGALIRYASTCCTGGLSDGLVIDRDEQGRPVRLTNPSGHVVTMEYAGDLVSCVRDSFNRFVRYSYDANARLTGITDLLGSATAYEYDSNGLLTRVTQPGSRVTSITYEGRRVKSVVQPDGSTGSFEWLDAERSVRHTSQTGKAQTFRFDESGKLVGKTLDASGAQSSLEENAGFIGKRVDYLGNSFAYTFDADGYLKTKTDALGRVTAYEWNKTARKVSKKTDELGRVWSYTYCPRGYVTSVTDPAGGVTAYTYDRYGNRASKQDPLGRVSRYSYDSLGDHLVSVTDPLGRVASFTYDDRGNLASSIDALGRATRFAYDQADRLVKTSYPDGRTVEITYDAAGNVAARKDNLGRITSYQYAPGGKLLKVIRPDGTEMVFTYNAAGQKTTEADPLGRVTRFEYDGFGNLSKVMYPDNTSVSRTYDAEGQLLAETDELGNTTEFEYDPMGNVVRQTDPLLSRWEYSYDAGYRRVQEKDPLGRLTQYRHDALDRVVKLVRPDNTSVLNAFDPAGNLLRSTDALGNVWSYRYDALDRVIEERAPSGAVTRSAYNAVGQLVSETDALGRKTQYWYDAGGRRVKTVDAGSGSWLNAYDAGGRLISARDPLGAASVFAYDLLDRLVSEKNPNGQVTRHEYDRAGRRIATIDALGRRSVTAFDLRDRVTSVTDPEGRLVSFGYDEGGRRVRLTDGANRIWRWNYDALDRVLNETDPLNHIVRYTYDGVGNVTARTNARGQTISYGYDPMNRLVRAEYPGGGVATFAYDLEGREISRFGAAGGVTKTWDSVGNLTSEKFHPWNRGWQLFYDRAGNRIKGISPDNETFLYGYDALNRLITLDPPGSDNTVSQAYDKAGRLVTTRRGDLVSMFDYDRASRLVSLRHESWRTLGKQIRKEPLLVRSYVYDAVGNVVRETDEKGQLSRFTYDGSDWLVGCEYPGGQRTSYAYNGAGDRLIERTGNQSVSYRYDEAGRLIGRGNVSLDYDADGNLVRENAGTQGTEYAWTSDNRLSSVAVKTACKRHTWAKCVCPGHRSVEEYAYLPEDWRRIGRTTNGVNYASIYDGDDESHEYLVVPGFLTKAWQFGRFCIRPSLPQLIRQREFIGGPGTDDLQCTTYFCRDLWMLQDRLGSTIGLAHRSGALVGKIGYDAWGNFRWPGSGAYLQPPCREDGLGALLDRFGGHILGGSLHDPWNLGYHFAKVLTPYLYAGRRLDAFTGNYNNRNRYYSPKYGRFTSQDPIGFNGGNNLWAYTNNNPLRYTDPFGLAIDTAIDLLSGSNYHYFYNLLQGAYGLGTPNEINWDEIDRLLREMSGNPCLASVRDEILTDPGYKKFKVIRALDQIFKSHDFSKEEIAEAVERISKFIQKYQMDDPRVAAIIRQVIEEILNRRS